MEQVRGKGARYCRDFGVSGQKKHVGPDSLAKILSRPDRTFDDALSLDNELRQRPISKEVREQVEIEVKYKGYIERQYTQIEKFKRMEDLRIPAWIDYSTIAEIRKEARQKLTQIRPISLGQASRISGVSPADVSILMIYLAGEKEGITDTLIGNLNHRFIITPAIQSTIRTSSEHEQSAGRRRGGAPSL